MATRRTLTLCAVAVCISGLLSGCVRLSQTLIIEDDGSGTLSVEYSSPDTVVTRMEQLRERANEIRTAGAMPPAERRDVFFPYTEDLVRERWLTGSTNGVALTLAKASQRQGRQHMQLEITFDSVSDLNACAAFVDQSIELTKTERGDYQVSLHIGDGPIENPPDLRNDAVLKEVRPFLSGFRYEMRIEAPSRVLSANTFRKTQEEATWNYDFDVDAMAFVTMQDAPMILIYDGAELREEAEPAEENRDRRRP